MLPLLCWYDGQLEGSPVPGAWCAGRGWLLVCMREPVYAVHAENPKGALWLARGCWQLPAGSAASVLCYVLLVVVSLFHASCRAVHACGARKGLEEGADLGTRCLKRWGGAQKVCATLQGVCTTTHQQQSTHVLLIGRLPINFVQFQAGLLVVL